MSRRRRRLSREPVTATIESLSHEGRGITHVGGKTVFVDETLPGETVSFQYTRQHSRYSEAIPLEILEPSPERIPAKCDFFSICGGCSFQHVSSGYQIKHKQQTLSEQFQRIGGIQPREWLPPLTGPAWGYRRRARLAVKYVEKKQRLLVGFREKSSPFVADISHCEVLHRGVGDLLEPLQELISGLSVIRQLPQIEIAVADNAVALVFRHLQALTDIDRTLLEAFAARYGIRVYLQPGGLNTVTPLTTGREDPLFYHLGQPPIKYFFLPTDFIQVNARINEAMVELAIQLLALDGSQQVLDLFCGLGNFSLPLARKSKSVTAIEGDAGLIERARKNADHNNIDNIKFHTANLADDKIASEFMANSYDRVMLDPPRTGADIIIRQLNHKPVDRVVYVSCNPATLARDAGILVNEMGYRLDLAGVMDMFPQTAHIESIALFTR